MADPVFKVKFENRAATIANIYSTNEYIQDAVRKSVEKNGELARDLAEEKAPESQEGDYRGAGTQRLKRSITLRLSDDKLVWEVFSDRNLFKQEQEPGGFNGRYYAPYVEARTQFLNSAWEEYAPKTSSEVGRAIRFALKKKEVDVKLTNA